MRLFELFNDLFPMSQITGNKFESIIRFDDTSGTVIEVSMLEFDPTDRKAYGLAFTRGGSDAKTGEGEAFKIFATVIAAAKELTLHLTPDVLFFSSAVSDGNRSKLYKRLIAKFAHDMGYTILSRSELDSDLLLIANLFDDSDDLFFLVSIKTSI